MNVPSREGFAALTEKEKQTLRLIVRGHNAKSVARNLDLSVHTINERLRDARRKLAVSSSREAARLLFAAEGDQSGPQAPDLSGDMQIGEDPLRRPEDQERAPVVGVARGYRGPLMIGATLMILALGLAALLAVPEATTVVSPSSTSAPANAEVVDAAREFLVLLDQGRWDDSYRSTASAFRKLNTGKVWAAASDQARKPLGSMISRTFVSQENLPAPPAGYEVVKFRTVFANKANALETVSLDREGGSWRVVGVTIE